MENGKCFVDPTSTHGLNIAAMTNELEFSRRVLRVQTRPAVDFSCFSIYFDPNADVAHRIITA